MRGLYSIVRYLPNVNVGEFINVGVILLNTVSGEWGYRRIDKYNHLNLLADEHAIKVVEAFFESLPRNSLAYAPKAGTDTENAKNWLFALVASNRSTMQMSEPLPTLFEGTIEEEIDKLFNMFIIEE